ncbi:MAG: major capsid protein [Microviridae sp.]|nr:MAG: major capsid protein [Microviridae sp.]
MGKLVPVGLIEALPGDTFQHSTSLLLRMSPLMAPVMHPVSIRIHHWFVPNRLMWDGWEDFITGGKDGSGTALPYPANTVPITPTVGQVYDYLGLPLKTLPVGAVNMMPITAYNRIYNEFYRDEDLAPEVADDDGTVKQIAWEKDYFTSARPWSQKGPSVSVPISGMAPIVGTGLPTFKDDVTGAGAGSSLVKEASAASATTGIVTVNWSGTSAGLQWDDPQLQADLSMATGGNIIDVRRAFALQRYQEARAMYGSRYTEYLRYLGLSPADSRLQRPEYLGGGKQTVSFSEVLRTGNETAATTSPIGEMKGHGIAALRSNRYRYFCQEHGYILTMLSIRPRTMYMDGLEKTWSRRTKEDYYQKELEFIGQQEVYNREVYAAGTAEDNEIFGYNDRYQEYRHQYSQVTGEFRNLLDYWHLGRKFADTPVLNKDFIECDPSKRIFAEQTQNSCWLMVQHNVKARRLLGHSTIGRVI